MGVGHHEAAWRHPRTDARRTLDVSHFQDLARIAERGKLDSVFFADGLAVGPRVERFTEGAADGFKIMPPYLPGGLEDFVEHVVPILQQRRLSGPTTPRRRCAGITDSRNRSIGSKAAMIDRTPK
jgi:alkanesulfonate monooxygenase SsuD/methylene tetrahydromethanopterin reductase-like flavin-dependent oxidoreductase (luciferase family)